MCNRGACRVSVPPVGRTEEGVGSSALPRVGKWVPLIGRAEIETVQSEYVHVKDVGKVTVALTQTSATCRPVNIVEGLVVQHVNLPPVTWASHVGVGLSPMFEPALF